MTYTADTVNAWYQAVQFRNGPAATVASTVALLNSPGGITPANAQLSIINDSFTSTYVNPMIRIYQAAFGRVPDQAGQNFWVDSFAAGSVTTLTAATNFANSTEFNATYSANASSAINAAVLTAFYQNVLNRAPDAVGFQFWLNSGQTVAQVLNYFAQSTEFTLASASAINQFQQAEINLNPATSGSLFQYGGFPTDSVALTTGVDTLNLLKNTTVTGVVNTVAGSTDSTFQSFDTITAAAGTTNNLNLTVTGVAVASTLPAASVSGVANINTRAVLTTAATITTIDAANFAGAANFTSDRSTSVLKIDNLSAGQTVGIIGNGSVANAAVTAGYGATVTTGTLNLATGVTGTPLVTINGAGLTTVNVNSFSAVNSIGTLAADAAVKTVNVVANTALTTAGITGGALTTINVSGGASNISSSVGAVVLNTLAGTVTTVDASKLVNGGVSATLGAGIATGSLKGGQGTNFITTGGVVLSTGTVAGGASIADRLIATNVADITAVSGARYSGFEVLQNNGAGSLNASFVSGVTSIALNNAAAGAIGLTAAQAGAVSLLASTTGTIGLTTATGTSDVLSLSLSPTTATDVVNFAGTVTGFETLKASVNSGITTAMTKTIADGATYNKISFAGGGAANLKTITVTGAYDAGVNVKNATAVTSIDLSGTKNGGNVVTLGANTGALVVTGSDAADFVTLDTVGGAGTQTVNLGLGNDFVYGTQLQVAVATIAGGDGTDTLTFTDVADITVVDATFANVAGINKIAFGSTAGQNTAVTNGVGGFQNALATANGGVLDLTAAYLTDLAATTINASALSAGNSLKLTAKIADDAGGVAAFSVTGSSGADNITVSSGAGVGGAITVSATAGTAAKTIDLSGVAASGAVSVTTGAGADVIKGGATAATYDVGNGADSLTYLAAHAIQTLVVGNGASTVSAYDVVTNYTLGQDIFDWTAAGVKIANGNYTAAQTGVANLTASVAAGSGLIVFGGSAATGLSVSDALTAAVNLVSATNVAGTDAVFNLGGNAYVVEYNATAPIAVQLAGVTATSIGDGNPIIS